MASLKILILLIILLKFHQLGNIYRRKQLFSTDMQKRLDSKSKTKVITINTTLSQPITINHNPVETVDDFTYLGSVISADNGTKKDINTRLSKARSAFARLKSIWKSKVYSKKTKIHIYNSNVKSVLLYGSECWRIIQSDLQKLEVFQNNCLRRIQGIFWPEKIRNEDLLKRCNCHSIAEELKKRRFRWLGHVLQMTNERLPKGGPLLERENLADPEPPGEEQF